MIISNSPRSQKILGTVWNDLDRQELQVQLAVRDGTHMMNSLEQHQHCHQEQ
ncbi:mCG148211 [Mus musculus]|nr:mCG148211 [Mus musculus]